MTNHKSLLDPLRDVMKGLVNLLLMADNRELKLVMLYLIIIYSSLYLYIILQMYCSNDEYIAFLMCVNSG